MSTPSEYFVGMSGDTDAGGFGLFNYNPNTSELQFDISFFNVTTNVTGLHIHLGGAGVNGPVIYDLGAAGGLTSPVTGSVVLFAQNVGGSPLPIDQQLVLLGDEGLYVNLHSEANPSGEIRGQTIWNGYWGPVTVDPGDVWEDINFGNVPPPPFLETDEFPNSRGSITLIDPAGNPVVVQLAGPTTVEVLFDGPTEGSATDDDNDNLGEVQTEIVAMSLTGQHPVIGDVHVQLDPTQLSMGQIVERVNANPDVLDVAPFNLPPVGGEFVVDSFFDVFTEITINDPVIPGLAISLRPEHPIRIGGPITHKPPREGETLMSDDQAQPIQLLLPNGEPSGWMIGQVIHIPNPVPVGSIHGAKWDDRNGNGEWDDGEPGLSGWTIYVDLNGDGAWQQGEPWAETMVDDTNTAVDETGMYWIDDVPEGQWMVREVWQAGWLQTNPVDYHWVSVGAGSVEDGVNFGNMVEPLDGGSIHGAKWDDWNGNGEWDNGEPGLPGWTIYVDLNGDGAWQQGEPWAETMVDDTNTAVDETGMYWIDDVPAGQWKVREEWQPGWMQTYPVDYHWVSVGAGSVEDGVNFGNMVEHTGGLCGDLDGDGRVTLLDTIVTLQIAIGWWYPTQLQLLLGDFDGVDGIDVIDVVIFLQYLVGQIDVLDCGIPQP